VSIGTQTKLLVEPTPCLCNTVIQRLETRDSTIVGRTESVQACIGAFAMLVSASANGEESAV
jgi:hypothetical protein